MIDFGGSCDEFLDLYILIQFFSSNPSISFLARLEPISAFCASGWPGTVERALGLSPEWEVGLARKSIVPV
jgi:hypothetical protein